MNRTKYILRGMLLILIVLLVINLYRKTEDIIGRIAKFKIETMNEIKMDSLDTKHKLKLLDKRKTIFNRQFIEGAPKVRDGIGYLIGAVVVLMAVELSFFIGARRKTPE